MINETMNHDEYVRAIRRQVAATARAMLAHEIGFLIGARKLAALHRGANVADDDADFLAFTGIDAQTDDLPLGDERQQVDEQTLAKLQPDIEAAEEWAWDFGKKACLALIERFAENESGTVTQQAII